MGNYIDSLYDVLERCGRGGEVGGGVAGSLSVYTHVLREKEGEGGGTCNVQVGEDNTDD